MEQEQTLMKAKFDQEKVAFKAKEDNYKLDVEIAMACARERVYAEEEG